MQSSSCDKSVALGDAFRKETPITRAIAFR